jgi:hypothetical protein
MFWQVTVRGIRTPAEEPRMENAEYFIEKAAQCRHLAAGIPTPADPTVKALLALAEEFDAKAAAYSARARAAHEIGLGDDVVPIAPGSGEAAAKS